MCCFDFLIFSLIPSTPETLAKATKQLNLLKSLSVNEFINTLPVDSPELRPCPKKKYFHWLLSF